MKRELQKLIISSVFTFLYVIYHNSGLFRDSILKAIVSPFENLAMFFIFIIFILIGYLIFNFSYFLVKFILSRMKSKHNAIKVSSIIIFLYMLIYVTNDQLIINLTKEYEWIRTFKPIMADNIEIDSTNFFNYKWQRKAWETSEPEFLFDELLTFSDDSTFNMTGSFVVLDKLYLFRILLNIKHDINITGNWIYKNTTMINKDSLNVIYPIQIRGNILYINTWLPDAI
ncbi:hypothetical protein H8E88_02705 [candidate division KSB1 bacterium]|nr:hypothetical protein [candidate division KSB1 bacterium]